MKDVEDYCPYDKKDWRKWLELNHNKKEAVWLIFYKKKSPNYNLSWSESVDEALCFGWIDTIVKRLDENKYFRNFTKRNENSRWSENTLSYAKKLIKDKKMAPMEY